MVARHSQVSLEYCVWPAQCAVRAAWLQFTIIVPLSEINPDPARIPFCGDLGLCLGKRYNCVENYIQPKYCKGKKC